MLVGVRRLLGLPRATRMADAPPHRVDPASRLVSAVWGLLSLALLGFVLLFGQNSPLSDEWAFLAELTAEKPLLPWLFQPHNEHYFPLPRLVWVGLHRVSGYDFRAPMVLSVALMAGTAFALLAAARRIRGRSHAADLLIPALTLHLGHWENWLIGYQLAFTIPAATTGLILATLAGRTEMMSHRTLLACGLALLVLVLCGGPGVILAVPLACWVIFHTARIRRFSLLVPPLMALSYAAAYLAFRQHGGLALPPSSWNEKAATALEFLTIGTGNAGRWSWPVSGVLGALVMLGTCVGLVRIAVMRTGSDRHSALGLLAVLIGVLGIAAAIGVSRTGLDAHPGFSSRYGLFSALGLVTAYLAAVRFIIVPKLSAAIPVGVLIAILIVALSFTEGIAYGKYYRHATRSMRYGVRHGDRPEDLAPRNVTTVFAGEDTPQTRAWMLDGMHVLARHRIGVFR